MPIEYEKISLDYLINSSSEDDYLNMIDRKSFYKKLRKYQFDYVTFFKNKNATSIDKEKFNSILKKLKKNRGINIVESLLYFEADFIDMTTLISLLDDDIKFLIKEELSVKYHKKIERNKLKKFLDISE
jgi:hypothetical protein